MHEVPGNANIGKLGVPELALVGAYTCSLGAPVISLECCWLYRTCEACVYFAVQTGGLER